MSIIGFLIFGLVIGLIARAIFPGRQQMGWLSTAVLGMVGSLVGVSRVYLGVHYPSDVVAGWVLGAAIGLALIAIARLRYAVRVR